MAIASVQFTSTQLAEITRLRDIARSLPVDAVGAYAPMYSYIAQLAYDAEQAAFAIGQTPDPDIHLSWVWLTGAVGVNKNEGAFSTIIREYNKRQGELRYGTAFSDAKLQEASNAVGEKMYQQIFAAGGNQWKLPTVEEIGKKDLEGVRDVLYGGEFGDLPLNQAWPGILMLGKLGEDFTGRLLQHDANSPVVFDTLEDAMNVLFAWESFRHAFENTSISDIGWRDVRVALNINELADFLNGTSAYAWFKELVGTQNSAALAVLDLVAKVGSNHFLDMLIGTSLGKPVYGLTTDGNFDTNAQTYFGALTPAVIQSLHAELMPISAAAMVAKAKTDVNVRAALAALSSVVVEVAPSIAAELDLYDPVTGTGELTDLYLKDRAAMLSWKMKYDSGAKDDDDVLTDYLIGGIPGLFRDKAYSEEWDADSISGNWDFVDLGVNFSGSSLQLAIDGKGITLYDHQIVFGSTNADTLEGSGDTDHLYGNAGDDTLTGKGGNDYLEGGSGFDTYVVNPGDGFDTVLDSDGSGVIKFGTLEAKGSTGVDPAKWIHTAGSDTWTDQQNGIVYSKSVVSGETRLLIKKGDATVLVKGWAEGELGIALGAGTPPVVTPPPATSLTLTGDFKPVDADPDAGGVQLDYDELGNVVVSGDADPDREDTLYDSVGSDRLLGLGGNDTLNAWRGGDDHLEGGAGEDWLRGGDGNDHLEGGSDSDVLNGGANNDKLFGGDAITDLAAAIVAGETQPGSGGRGDWLSADAGADTLVGDAGNDVLLGGENEDLLIGGGGDDSVYGDRSGNADIGWSITRTITTVGDVTTYNNSASAGGWTDAAVGAADVIYGGAGDDWIEGDQGNDIIDAGADNDVVFGGQDADVILGQGGNDVLVGNGGVSNPLNDGADYIDGGAGNDELWGGGGNDTLLGGTEDDILTGDGNGTLEADEGEDVLDGGAGNDTLFGNGNNDTLLGGADSDELYGGAGDDTLDGGDGIDYLAGGADNDTYLNVTSDDTIFDTEGTNTIILKTAIGLGAGGLAATEQTGSDGKPYIQLSVTLADGSALKLDNPFFASGTTTLQFAGGDALDLETLVSESLVDSLRLGLGDEGGRVYGGAGDDVLAGGAGDDTLIGHGGNDLLQGGAGDDTYLGVASGDDILDVEGNNLIVLDAAGLGVDGLSASIQTGDDGGQYMQLSVALDDGGALKLNSPFFSSGTTTLQFAGGDAIDLESLVGESLADSVNLALGSNGGRLYGGAGDDILTGAGGNDILIGHKGDDLLRGGSGDDVLEGGAGNDTLEGGAGFDVYRVGVGNDLVVDAGSGNRVAWDTPSTVRGVSLQIDNLGRQNLVLAFADDATTTIRNGFLGAVDTFSANGSDLDIADFLDDHVSQNLALQGSLVADRIAAGAGDDFIDGSLGDDVLAGGRGDDQLLGGAGADTLAGGQGNDRLDGGSEADIYLFGRGDGADTVAASVSTAAEDEVHLGADIASGDLRFYRLGDDSLLARVDGTQDSLLFEGWFAGGASVNGLRFADGTLLAASEMSARAVEAYGGTAGDDVLTATDAGDRVQGFGGNDTLRGGAGDDALEGGEGDDIYVFGWDAQGNDTALESSAGGSVLALAEGTTLAELQHERVGDDLKLALRGGDATLTLKDYFVSPHDWTIREESGSTTAVADWLALPDPAFDLSRLQSEFVDAARAQWAGDIQARYGQFKRLNASSYESRSVSEFATNIETKNFTLVDNVDDAALIRRLSEVASYTSSSVDIFSQVLAGAPTTPAQTGSIVGLQFISLEAWPRRMIELGVSGLPLNGMIPVRGNGGGIAGFLTGESLQLTSRNVIRRYFRNSTTTNTQIERIQGGDSDNVIEGFKHASYSGEITMIDGGGGNDTLRLPGFPGLNNEVFYVTDSDTRLGGFGYGNTGNDTILGGYYRDTLVGGDGDDYLNGGFSQDTYVMFAGEVGIDTIWDTGTQLEQIKSYGDMGDPEVSSLPVIQPVPIAQDTLRLVGIGQGEIAFSWGQRVVEGIRDNWPASDFNGIEPYALATQTTHAVLRLSWTGGGVEIVLPNATDLPGLGLERIQFGDGTSLSMTELIALAGPAPTLNPQELDNAIVGGADRDLIFGEGGNDMLQGGDGADLLDGGTGDDVLSGGDGDDVFVVDSALDIVAENADEGIDTIRASVSHTLDANVERLVLTGSADIDGTGNALDNTLIGNAASNTLVGGAGNDVLHDDKDFEGPELGSLTIRARGTPVLGGYPTMQVFVDGVLIQQFTVDAADYTAYTVDPGLLGMTASRVDVAFVNDAWRPDLGQDRNLYVQGIEVNGRTIEATDGGVVLDTGSGAAAFDGLNIRLGQNTLGSNGALRFTLAGNDTLDGGVGADQMTGGEGNDTYVVDDAGDTLDENEHDGGVDTVRSSIGYALGDNLENLILTGTASIDGAGNALANLLQGNAGNNILHGDAGADTLIGLAGNDRLDGGAGGDFMFGGTGNDIYVVDNAGDGVSEGANQGLDTVESSIGYTLGANLENLTLAGSAAINGTGNDLNNALVGNGAGNVLSGGAGNDRLDGGAGADTLIGGTGNDAYVVDDAGDVVVERAGEGTSDSVALYLNADYVAPDNIEYVTRSGGGDWTTTGNAGDNYLYGNEGRDTLIGLVGNDVLWGNTGADTLIGGLGDDRYYVDDAGDTLTENAGEGTDTVYLFGPIAYTLAANVENAYSPFWAGHLTGNDLDNWLSGSYGADTLDGGLGADTLNGWGGNDIYVFGRSYGTDTILENDAAVGNLDVARFLPGVTADQIWFRHVGDDLEASIVGTADRLLVKDWYLDPARHVERFETADGGLSLLDSQIENLVNAMASFAPPAAGQTTLPSNYQTALAPVIAANWQ